MHTKAAGLSGGLKRRLKLAVELLADRQILFLGESWATFSVKAPSARIEGKCFYKLAPLVDRCPWCPRVEYTLDFAVPVAPVRFAGFALVDVKSPRSAPPWRYRVVQLATLPHTPHLLHVLWKDEPTSGLDAHSSLELMDIMKRLSRKVLH